MGLAIRAFLLRYCGQQEIGAKVLQWMRLDIDDSARCNFQVEKS
jgi:hypothetical protein